MIEGLLYKSMIFIKYACLAGAIGVGSYIAYQSLPTSQFRLKLKKCFEIGEIHLGSIKTRRIFPKIHAVTIGVDKVDLVFSIPLGLNPKEVIEKDWLFKQQFGENIELTQENKKFTLTILKNKLPSVYKYNFKELEHLAIEYRLPIISGMSSKGIEMYDMVEQPHLLIAGETGSGKSTQLRSIISLLIQSKSPHDLEFYMADLKRSEFHLFRRVEHVKKIVNDKNGLVPILIKLKAEMIRRGNLLDQYEQAHIDDLPFKLPYIILCIDEVALLKKEREIMDLIEEISSIGRALGVFLILSMQRPDAQVLDGKLKNNLTVRMAFKHADEINSRITLGSGEAAQIKITERGRHYLKGVDLKLVQGPFLPLTEAKKLLEPYKVPKEEMEEIDQSPVEISEEEEDDIELGVLE